MNSSIDSKYLIDNNEDINLLTLFYLLWKDKFKILGFAIPISLIVFFSFNFLNSQYQFSKKIHENNSNYFISINSILNTNFFDNEFLNYLSDKEFVKSTIKENSFEKFQSPIDDVEDIISSYEIKNGKSINSNQYYLLSFKSIDNKFPESVFYDLLDHANNKSLLKIKKIINDEILYVNEIINDKIEQQTQIFNSKIDEINIEIKKEIEIQKLETKKNEIYLNSNLNIAEEMGWDEPYPNLQIIVDQTITGSTNISDHQLLEIPTYFFGTRIINQKIEQNKNNLSSPEVEKMKIEIFHLKSKLENVNLYVDISSELMKLKKLTTLDDLIVNKKLFRVHDELIVKFEGLSMIKKIIISIIIGLFASFSYVALRKIYLAMLTS